MINRNKDRAAGTSFLPKFSDPDVFRAATSSEFWGHVFLGDRRALWLLTKALLFLKMEMFAAPLRACLRYGHGKRTTGVFITLSACAMMAAFNAEGPIGPLAAFFPVIAPLLPFIMGGAELWEVLFVDVRSRYLMYFWMAHLALSVVHLARAANRPSTAPAHRGTSLLHVLGLKRLGIGEGSVQLCVEPALVAVLGHALMSTGTDWTFGLFLIIAASCLLLQEVFEAVMKFSIGL